MTTTNQTNRETSQKPQKGHSYHIIDNTFMYHALGATLFGHITNETTTHYDVYEPIEQHTYEIPRNTDRFTFHRNMDSAMRYTIDHQKPKKDISDTNCNTPIACQSLTRN